MGVCCVRLTLEQAKEKADLIGSAKLIFVAGPMSDKALLLSGRKWAKETKRIIASEGTQDLQTAVFIMVDDLSGREYAEAVALVLQIKGEVEDPDDPFEPVEVILD